MDAATAELEKRAGAGDMAAQIALGLEFEARGNARLARGWFARAAKSGSIEALRLLGANLLEQPPISGREGVIMVHQAEKGGDAEAAHLCGLLATLDRFEERWRVAYGYSERAAERGAALARAEMDFLQKLGGAEALEELAAPMTIDMKLRHPRIGIIENFLSQEICDWLIARAQPRLSRALVYDPTPNGSRYDQGRNNSAALFNIAQSDLILMTLRARIAATATTAEVNMDQTAILHYAPGECFEPHYDFLDTALPAYAREVAAHGQRAVTFLVYLNDDFEGGETDFPKLDWRYKGRKGDALVFWNVDESGKPDQSTQHAGLPTTRGEKWLVSQWLRVPQR